jgi:iron complex outermembrane receptor protein
MNSPIELRPRVLRRGLALALAALLACATAYGNPPATPAPPRPGSDLETLDLEQLMEIEVVFAGSKREQQARAVPSFVSVVTGAQIKAHGYRTLADVLKTLPSFYISSDRNYSFVGVRGFERAGDYNTRILLLQNGLRTNDNVYDAASIGEEFVVDVDLIDRIEVIRGPSAAIYGSNAFFAVVNVVTLPGRSLQGAEVALSAASFGTRAGRASYGRALGNGLDLLFSASYSDAKGQSLYFPEYDQPETNNGVFAAGDRESFHKLLATVSKGSFSFQASSISREKGIPTGAYGTLFNDPRTQTVDSTSLASLSYNRAFASGVSLSTRLHGGHWTYKGAFAYAPDLQPSQDDDVGDWWGVDVDASRAVSRHFLTVGAEYRDNYRQDLKTYDPEPFFVYTDLKNKSQRWGLFAQDEIKLVPALTLYAGLRYDRYAAFGTTSPRVGLIFNRGSATTVKLLAGRAFRAPNEFELSYESPFYRSNPGLKPERIETLELMGQRLIGGGLQVTVSTFRNRLSALISQRVDSGDNDRLVFENADAIESKGIEIAVQVNRGRGPTGQVAYSLQRTEDRATGAELTNSPRHLATVQLLVPLARKISAALDAQYVSERKTFAGLGAHGYTVANVSLLVPRLARHVDLSATIYNLFDTRYGVPGSEDLLQDVIPQDGRSFRVKTTLHF